MKRTLLVLSVICVLPFGIWTIGVSEGTLRDILSIPAGSGFRLEAAGLDKGLFYNFSARQVVLKREEASGVGDAFLTADDMKGWLGLKSLLTLSPRLYFEGKMGDGSFTASLELTGKRDFTMEADRVNLKSVPFLAARGIRGRGTLSWDLRMKDNAGEIKFRVDEAELQDARMEGFPLPLDLFRSVRGLVRTRGDEIEVQSLAMEGNGVYARLKGKVAGDDADATMEIMVETQPGQISPLFSLIERYKVSSGYYRVPVRQKISR